MSCCPKPYTDGTFINTGTISTNSAWSEDLQAYVSGAGHIMYLTDSSGSYINMWPPAVTYGTGPIFLPDGTIWSISWAAYGAGTADQPDGGPSLSSSVLALHQIRGDGGAFDFENKEITLEVNIGPLGTSYDGGLDQSTGIFDQYAPAGIDFNPVDGLIYFGVDRLVGTTVTPGITATTPPTHAQVWVTDTSGVHSLLYTSSEDNSSVSEVAAASDGAVWLVTSDPLSGFNKHILRKPLGSSTFAELTLTGDVDFQDSLGFAIVSRGIATPWGAMLYPIENRSVSFVQQYYEVRPDGATKIWVCPKLENTGQPILPMRTLDFSKTYFFLFDPYPTLQFEVLDWKKCGGGWVVGGMPVNG